MTLDILDLATLITAVIVGAYIVLARRVHAVSHGWGCALWHLGAVGLCAGAAVDAMHGRSGAWLLGVAAVVVWLAESRHTWHEARPRRPRLHPAAVPGTRRGGGVGEERAAAVVMRGGGVGEE
jgi:hypothetical protein